MAYELRPQDGLRLTAVVIACIASNPEFASFVPMLDAVGVDVLAYMVASQ